MCRGCAWGILGDTYGVCKTHQCTLLQQNLITTCCSWWVRVHFYQIKFSNRVSLFLLVISEFHWWSKSHKLRYLVVRSWWGEFMHTVTYEMHDLGCIELTLILFLEFTGNLWVLVSDRTYLIRVFRKTSIVIMFVEYLGCVDPCEIYVIF